MSTQVYQLSGGGIASLPNKTIQSPRNPGATDLVDPNGSSYQSGQYWRNTLTNSMFFFVGASATSPWIEVVESGGGPITTINNNAPQSGNYTLAGTASQITVTQSLGTSTFALAGPYTPATYTAHGVLMGEGSSSIVASSAGTSGQVFTSGGASADGAYQNIGVNSGLTAHGVLIGEGNSAFAATSAGTAGQLLTSGGAGADPTWTTATFPGTVGATGTILRSNGTNWVASTDTFPDTVVAGDILIATATNVVGSLADVATGQILASGGVGVAPAYTASPSVTGSITAGTTITATLGAITATNGNLVFGTAGNKISAPAATTTTAGANSFGTVALVAGSAVVATTAVTATSIILITNQVLGTVAAPFPLAVTARTAATSFTITSADGTDTSTIGWMIIN